MAVRGGLVLAAGGLLAAGLRPQGESCLDVFEGDRTWQAFIPAGTDTEVTSLPADGGHGARTVASERTFRISDDALAASDAPRQLAVRAAAGGWSPIAVDAVSRAAATAREPAWRDTVDSSGPDATDRPPSYTWHALASYVRQDGDVDGTLTLSTNGATVMLQLVCEL